MMKFTRQWLRQVLQKSCQNLCGLMRNSRQQRKTMLLDRGQLTVCSIQNMLYLWMKLAATQVKKGIKDGVEKNN
jgi:hypothetical protein